jgi:hypothetical protein
MAFNAVGFLGYYCLIRWSTESLCQELTGRSEEFSCTSLYNTIMCELWVFCYSLLNNKAASRKVPVICPPKKADTIKSARKVLMIIFLSRIGILYQLAVPHSTVNGLYYADIVHMK